MFGIDEHTIVTLDSGVDGGNQRGRLWVTMNVTMTGLRCENLAFRAFNKFGQTDTHNLNNFAHMTFVNTDARGNSLYTIQREMEQKPNTLGFEGVDHHGPLAYVASGSHYREDEWVPISNAEDREEMSHLEVWEAYNSSPRLKELMLRSTFSLVFFGASADYSSTTPKPNAFCPQCLDLEAMFEVLAREIQARLVREEGSVAGEFMLRRETLSDSTLVAEWKDSLISRGISLINADCNPAITKTEESGDICGEWGISTLPHFQLFVRDKPVSVYGGNRKVKDMIDWLLDEIARELIRLAKNTPEEGSPLLALMEEDREGIRSDSDGFSNRRKELARRRKELELLNSDTDIFLRSRTQIDLSGHQFDSTLFENGEPVGCEVSMVMETGRVPGNIEIFAAQDNGNFLLDNADLSHVINHLSFSHQPPEGVDVHNSKRRKERWSRVKKKKNTSGRFGFGDKSSLLQFLNEDERGDDRQILRRIFGAYPNPEVVNSVSELSFGETTQHHFIANPHKWKDAQYYTVSHDYNVIHLNPNLETKTFVLLSYDVNPFTINRWIERKVPFYDYVCRLLGLLGGTVSVFRLVTIIYGSRRYNNKAMNTIYS